MKTYLSNYEAPDSKLWRGRADSLPNERFFQVVECIDLNKASFPTPASKSIGIVGFCCDEGVKRNLGRIGAAEGPNEWRKAFANMPNHTTNLSIYDFGNINCDDNDLESAQEKLGELISEILAHGIMPIVIGGGHEVAWGHYQGLTKAKPRKNIGIINIDAHYDLRPKLDGNKGSSGTPFLQISEDCKKNNKPFNYCCIGIQETANTPSLFETAKNLGVNTILAKDLKDKEEVSTKLNDFIANVESIYLTICMDTFCSGAAPGVSAPQPLGPMPSDIMPILKKIIDNKKVISVDVAELSPKHDVGNKTSTLAAVIIAQCLYKLSDAL